MCARIEFLHVCVVIRNVKCLAVMLCYEFLVDNNVWKLTISTIEFQVRIAETHMQTPLQEKQYNEQTERNTRNERHRIHEKLNGKN